MLFSYFKKINTFKVDFNKPWWYPIYQQKCLFLATLIFVSISQIFWSLIPFIIGKTLEINNFYICSSIFALWFTLERVSSFFRGRLAIKSQLQCIHSLYESAYTKLLAIDLKYHVHRSSGKVISKIERGARKYEDFTDYLTFELMPLIIGLITVISTLAYYSFYIAITMALFITTILWLAYIFAKKILKTETEFIETDDAFKAIATENLLQVQMIRQTFASMFRQDLLEDSIKSNIKTESKLWLSYSDLFRNLNSIYIVSLLTLTIMLIWQIKIGYIGSTIALSLLLVYIQSSKEIVRFALLLRKINNSKSSIEDLFKFLADFGQQTIPVLGNVEIVEKNNKNILLKAKNIVFDYGKGKLFDNHTLEININNDTKNLIGLIGPSGVGKTTLLSILGGQLKPISGQVLLNNIDVYKINDATRSELMALQGQTSSSLRGTVKNNLLLGLPKGDIYTDKYLNQVLDNVGLLNILNQHDGLYTMLGEGGLNLSGGQRQRLNFAGLYLRVKYYNPLLVLIDEPTSSLDEISEKSIVNMIEEISKDAITLVIAHRLKTIENAAGIIDLSLMNKSKDIKIYSVKELAIKSDYYKELISGKISLE